MSSTKMAHSSVTSLLTVLDKGWPFAASVLAGVYFFGSLSSDIHQLKQDQRRIAIDHDTVISLVQGQKDMKDTLGSIQDQLNRIEKQRDK